MVPIARELLPNLHSTLLLLLRLLLARPLLHTRSSERTSESPLQQTPPGRSHPCPSSTDSQTLIRQGRTRTPRPPSPSQAAPNY
ncbi:hypothetical protein FKP32DRAFT_1591576 [Trametes sanguinea]|nr:hypothetical protein FKP32DRAFT_1591576 [Trametes sanguinea]